MALDLSKYGEPISSKAVSAGGLDLSKYGEIVQEDNDPPEESGFFKDVYKSLFSPVVNLIARPGQAVQAALGQEVSEGDFFGLDITNPQNKKDVLRDVGRGLETVSLGIGGGGVKNVVQTGFREGVKQGAKEGAILGLKSSPVYGVGASLTQGNTDIQTILKDAATATAFGVPTAAVFGAAGPFAKGAAKKFTDQGVRDELGNIYRQTGSQYVKSQAILDQAAMVNKTDPIAVLQMYGKNVLPEMKGNGAQTEEAQAFLRKKIGELSELRNEDLFLNDSRVPIPGYKKYAEELLDAQSWSEAKKAAVRNDLNKIMQSLDEAYADSPKNVDGIELLELNKIKTEQTALSKSYNNKAPKFDYDAHSIAGKAARDLIELMTESETTKDLNKLIQSHYDAIDFLDALNGKKVHGGALSKLFFKLTGDVVGATAGTAMGSPVVGAVTGHVIAGKIADIVQNRFITNPVKAMLINNLKEQTPREVSAVLMSLETKYKNIFDDIFPNGVDYSDLNNANNASPIKNPATTANMNAIPTQNTTGGQGVKRAIPNDQSFGAVAGFEKDEKGNINFDPKKAALGMAGFTVARSRAGKAVTDKIIKEIDRNVAIDFIDAIRTGRVGGAKVTPAQKLEFEIEARRLAPGWKIDPDLPPSSLANAFEEYLSRSKNGKIRKN